MAENLLESCKECFEVALNTCADRIFIDAGLSGDLFYRVTDKFDNKYSDALQYEDGNQIPFIPISDLPPGLFTPHSGSFKLEVFTQITGCEPQTLTFCDVEYDCVLMTFEKVFTTEA